MSTMFEDLKQGLEEAIAFEKGEGSAKVYTFTIKPVQEYTNKEIRSIRLQSGMTQKTSAYYMGVSSKTVEAWENGRTHPSGSAFRLLQMLKEDSQNTRYIMSKS